MRITTVSSGRTTTHAFTSGAAAAGVGVFAAASPNGMWKPKTSPPAEAAEA